MKDAHEHAPPSDHPEARPGHHDHDHDHDDGHGRAHGHEGAPHHDHSHQDHADDCCGGGACATVEAPHVPVSMPAGSLVLRIPAMDCPTEEGQIRIALERSTDVRRLSFDLAGRVLAVEAPSASW